MAESTEHSFLSESVISIIENASTSRLFAFRESDRKRYDFSCNLARDWQRVVAGQTLWKHTEGIDKDVRMLLTDAESDVTIYVARDTVKNRSVLHEAVSDFKSTELRHRISRLRTFWIPQDFDADIDEARRIVYDHLERSVSEDLLLAVILGGITRREVETFATWTGAVGLGLAVLSTTASTHFGNYSHLGKILGVSATTVKERVLMLGLLGFIERAPQDEREIGELYRITGKGRVLLDVCGRLYDLRRHRGDVGDGFVHICHILGINPLEVDLWREGMAGSDFTVENGRTVITMRDNSSARLAMQINAAVSTWEIELPVPHYHIPASF